MIPLFLGMFNITSGSFPERCLTAEFVLKKTARLTTILYKGTAHVTAHLHNNLEASDLGKLGIQARDIGRQQRRRLSGFPKSLRIQNTEVKRTPISRQATTRNQPMLVDGYGRRWTADPTRFPPPGVGEITDSLVKSGPVIRGFRLEIRVM